MRIIDDILANIPEGEKQAKVNEVRIGPFWTGVYSSNLGLASTTFVHWPGMPIPVKDAGNLTNKTIGDLCHYIYSESLLERTLAIASINSILGVIKNEKKFALNAAELLYQFGENKNVAIIGHFPFIENLKKIAKNLWTLERRPQVGDIDAEKADQIIPYADVVAITGTALINNTMDYLLKLCSKESVVMILGPTTPLSSVWFDYGIDFISGTVVTDSLVVLKLISEGVVFRQVHRRGIELVTISKEDAHILYNC